MKQEPSSASPQEMAELIAFVTDDLKSILLKKNETYGNAAADPLRIFSRVSPIEQLDVRIDDKLSRIARGSEFEGEDTELDLIGYLILKRAVKLWQANKIEYAGKTVNALDAGFEAAVREVRDPYHPNNVQNVALSEDHPRCKECGRAHMAEEVARGFCYCGGRLP